MPTSYAFDPTGQLLDNRITGEVQTITPTTNVYHVLVPNAAPFYAESLQITYTNLSGTTVTLVEGIDYHLGHIYAGASRATGHPVYGSIVLLNNALSGTGSLSYQTIGGQWVVDTPTITKVLSDLLRNPRTTTWEIVSDRPEVFPPTPHAWNLTDMVGQTELVQSVAGVASAIAQRAATAPTITLPAQVITARTIGLGNVDNYRTASDVEASGNSTTRFMTPRATQISVAAALSTYEQSRASKYSSNAMPTSGVYSAKDYVENSLRTILPWHSTPTTALEGVKYIVRGWIRMTDGPNHVANVDWVEDRVFVG